MKKWIKDIVLYIKYGYKSTSKRYKKYLQKNGISIGKETYFYSPWTTKVDIQRPWMIKIGNNVCFAAGVTILQHGYDWCVLQKKYGDIVGSCGKVHIGNNVFIGANVTILKGSEIGDNVIIGANSLVNKKLESNAVYAGNPVKYIMSIDEYMEKRKRKQLEEATLLVTEYYHKYQKYPNKELLREFFWLFEPRNEEIEKCTVFNKVFSLGDNETFSKEKFMKTEPIYNGYEEFINGIKIGESSYEKENRMD